MKRILALAIIALFLGVSSCDFLLGAMFSTEGNVVNVTSNDATEWYKGTGTETLVGATITYRSLKDQKTYTGTVSSSGRYVITSLPNGEYTVTGNKEGWTFIPKTVSISGLLTTTTEDILAYQNPAGEQILIITEWKNRGVDVDSVALLDPSNTFGTTSSFTTASTNVVYYGRPSVDTVSLDRDVNFLTGRSSQGVSVLDSVPLVETVRITGNPFSSTDNTGYVKFFLNAYRYSGTPTGELTGYTDGPIKEAKATVYVMKNNNATDGELMGVFRVASESAETTLGVLKVYVDGSNYEISSYANFGTDTYRSVR